MDIRLPSATCLLFLFAAGCSKPAIGASSSWSIASWAQNTRAGIAEFGISQLRMGCDDVPEACVQRAGASGQSEGIAQVAISIGNLRAGQLEDYAGQYGRLSKTNPVLAEISIDDFVSFMRHNRFVDIQPVISAIKSANPHLRFSVTVYEDQLDSIFKNESLYPSTTRAQIDRVYLYLHYRENYENFPRYVSQAHTLFPKAQIYGGSYAYDRIDYIACAQGAGAAPCSPDREIDLYRQSLLQQVALLQSGALAGLEFYPGQFGREDQWSAWNNPRICQPERRAQCIENTREMRRIAAKILNAG